MSQERIVNIAFMVAGLLMWFLGAHLFAYLFDAINPQWDLDILGNDFRLSDLLGAGVGVVGGISLWRNQRLFTLAHEIVGELRKVTWPSGGETRVTTVVVVVTTLLAAACLSVFDFVFSFLTRALYGI